MKKKSDYSALMLETMKSINQRIALANDRLNYATDNDLIDSLIYEIKALQTQYTYYNKICKSMGIISPFFGK